MKPFQFVKTALLISLLEACASPANLPNIVYPRAIYPLESYPTRSESTGFKAAAIMFKPGKNIYSDPSTPDPEVIVSSLNVLAAGLLPIRVILSNESADEILIDPEQIFGMAGTVIYQSYSSQEAVDLVLGSREFKEAVKGKQLGPVFQSLLGGEILLEGIKGGASGAATGNVVEAASGVAKGAAETGLTRANGFEHTLEQLLRKESEQVIHKQTLYPGYLTSGFVFLPSQPKIDKLVIKAYAIKSQKAMPISINLR